MVRESKPDAPISDPEATDRGSGHTRFRGREGLRSLVIMLFHLASVACLFLIGTCGR